jgi:hypothetical protein
MPAGLLLGLVSGRLLTKPEWEQLKWRSRPAAEGQHWQAWEAAHESYCNEVSAAHGESDADDGIAVEPETLFLSSFGYGARTAAAWHLNRD